MLSRENALLITYYLRHHQSVLLYFGAGYQMIFRKKYYKVQGPYSRKTSSNRVSEELDYSPIVKTGCKIYLAIMQK